jgi:hypothetical protein
MMLAGLVMLLVMTVLQLVVRDHLVPGGKLGAILDIVVVGLLGAGAYLLMARALRIREVTEVTALVGRRLPIRR